MNSQVYRTFTDEDWARSLVGRNWEIFWSDDNGDGDADTQQTEAQVVPASEKVDVTCPTTANEQNETQQEESDNDDSGGGGDLTDWYEARVLAVTKRDYEGFWFQVKFAGDDTIYDMTLIPSVVRPSARAWLKLSTALLSESRQLPDQNGKRSKRDMASWERDLPPSTVEVSDLRHIEEIRKMISLDQSFGTGSCNRGVSGASPGSTAPFPSKRERDDVLHLILLLRAQIYLRSRLAPFGDFKGKAKTENGELIPTDTYMDFMTKCLEELEKACCWYCRCWSFYQKVFPVSATGEAFTKTQRPPASTASFPVGVPPLAYHRSVPGLQPNILSHNATATPNFQHLQPSGPAYHHSVAGIQQNVPTHNVIAAQSHPYSQPNFQHLQPRGINPYFYQKGPSVSMTAGAFTQIQRPPTITASFPVGVPPLAYHHSVPGPRPNVVTNSATATQSLPYSQPKMQHLHPRGTIATNDNHHTGSSPPLNDITFVSRDCLEEGSDKIVSLCNMNLSADGASFRRYATPASTGTRRTKRRKVSKEDGPVILWEVGSSDGDDGVSGDEKSFGRLSAETLRRFVNHTRQTDRRWYIHHMTTMLLCVCDHIYDPLKSWKLQAEAILGVLPEKEDDSEEESSEEEGDCKGEGDVKNGDSGQEPGESSDGEKFYTYDDVRSCVETSENDRMLKRFDLSPWTSKLKEKMVGISSFEANGWTLLSRVLDDPGDAAKANDEVLAGLLSLKEASLSSDSHIANVHPLGSSTTKLTRGVIDKAISVRTWVLDLRHTEDCRERLAFVQNTVSQAAKLPHIPSPRLSPAVPSSIENTTSQLGQMMIRAQSLSSKLFPHIETISQYDHMVTNRAASQGDGVRLRTTPEVLQALKDLSSIPVVSLAEEKLAVRLDVLQWIEKARLSLANRTPSFHGVVSLKEHLDQLLEGSSPTRLRLVSGLEPNNDADVEIRRFAKSDVDAFCRDTGSMVEDLFSSSMEWKERVEAVITALRSYGNTSAGEPIVNTKLPAMVDLKRITDLLNENKCLGLAMPKQYSSILVNAAEEASKWSAAVENVILDASDPLDSLSLLMTARDARPKGVLMDPARHVVDTWIDVLDWHRRLKLSLEVLFPSRTSPIDDASLEREFAETEAATLYPLLMEGIDFVELFSSALKREGILAVDAGQVTSLMSKLHETQRPVRMLSISKLQSSPVGKKLLHYIGDMTCDMSHGSPIFCLLFVVWRLMVLEFVRRHTEISSSSSDRTQMPSLQEGKQLNVLRPQLPDVPRDNDKKGHQHISYFRMMFDMGRTSEVQQFEQLIRMGDQAEQETRAKLQSLKNLFRESSRHRREVSDYLTILKVLQSNFKSPTQLVLSRELENSLDRTAKDLGWLVRTFPYEALHADEMSSDNSIADSVGNDRNTSETNDAQVRQKKVPWEVLVSLFERTPVSSELGEGIIGGDLARVTLRVRELYDAAHAWQEEVSSFMSISFRGMKRRVPAGGATSPQRPAVSGAEGESQSTVDFRTLDRLSKDPILEWVSMPRQAAVMEVVKKAREFELRQRDLLDKDYEGETPDRARLPRVGSLVGKNGVFALYRLTGSGLYSVLQESLRSMSSVGSEVLAETPGKTTFVFITRAVSWIDRLRHAVTSHSPFEDATAKKLVIPASDARKLLEDGQALFLDVPEDVRKTLSKHKISISTNKQTAKVTVVIAKGGAHHSLGGTVLRWCPFLLESLKADVTKLSSWETSLVSTAEAVQSVTTKRFSGSTVNQDATYQWFRLREKLDFLLEEGRDALVVAPEPAFLKTVLDLKKALDNWANKTLCLPNGSIDVESLLARRYEDGDTVVEDRFLLLDSLLSRSRMYRCKRKTSNSDYGATAPSGNFRDKTRAVFERAFRKGMQMAGISDNDSNQSDSEIVAYCAIKSRELERAIYSKMQGKSVGKGMSSGYREKVRSLRYNLEDIKNPTLCARVLLGNISIENLVTMSSEQLASKDMQRSRAKAQAEATKNFVIAPGPQKDASAPKATVQPRGEPVNTKTIGSVGGILKAARRSPVPHISPQPRKKIRTTSPVPSLAKPAGKLGTTKTVPSPHPTPNGPPEGGSMQKQRSKDSVSPSFASPPSLKGLLKSVSSPPLAAPEPPSPPRIPPPPLEPLPPETMHPFATDANEWGSTRSTARSIPLLLTNASGGDRFSFSFSNPNVLFMAGLYLEDNRYSRLNGVIPEKLSVKGRLRIEEFSRFIDGKLSGGKWAALLLRLSTFSDLDALEYKKFYKDYEGKKRIAMFAIGKESKLFLVTPLFHGASKHLCESFSIRTATYAVLLTKDRYHW